MNPPILSVFISRLPGMTRIAVTREGRLEHLVLHRDQEVMRNGSIWVGRVTRVVPAIKAAFLDLGHCNVFLNDLPRDLGSKGGFEGAVKEGNLLAVQIRRLAHGDKLAQVTADLKLAGFSGVLLPFDSKIHFGRDFKGEPDPDTYRALLGDARLGWIVRSGVERLTPEVLQGESDALLEVWDGIKNQLQTGKPRLLLDRDPVLECLQMFWKEGIRSIFFDDEEQYRQVAGILERRNPTLLSAMKLHLDAVPLFDLYKVTSEISQAMSHRIPLKSGGWLDIRHTEGMIVIDVNSGKNIKSKAGVSSGMKTNLEAAAEIGRQAKIRNLAGLLVIDFINARDKGATARLDKALQAAFRGDPAKTVILPVNRLGLAQLSRERTGPDLHSILQKSCPQCRGTGMVARPVAAVMAIQEQLIREARDMEGETFVIRCGHTLFGYLISERAIILEGIEKAHGVTITVEREKAMAPMNYEVVLA